MTAFVVLAALAACAPRVQNLGPLTERPRMEPDVLIAADGARLPLRVWLPAAGKPRAMLLALHGFNDYGMFFKEPGAWFADRGFAVYAYDQRGFGAAPNPGLWPGTEVLADDLRAAVAALRGRHGDLPLYLVGASMGGAVILSAMADHNPPTVEGVVLSAPAVWGRATMPAYQRAALWLAAHTLPWVTVTGRGLKRRASDNVEMLRALGRDPLVIKETRIDALWGMANLMDGALAAAPRLMGPALILYGENDEIIPKSPVARMIDGLPAASAGRHRIARYPEGFHMLLRDLQAQTVWHDILAWIEDPAAPLPSGADGPPPSGSEKANPRP